ncbi:hypothetical protein AJ80_05098 [Polytolypa hystricis UAMH7299]|uniref:Uncharacterized protein n=1 Tax=Polytolypa hystricis (strain UAMH7299) TaxID=1447883 RepID=A0A2B7Y6W3_POLH7|nr:hypothetical protein AJ80_05098 [Polytolypa hystricis UAMH7299]
MDVAHLEPLSSFPLSSAAVKKCLQEKDDFQMMPLASVSTCFAIPPRVVRQYLPVFYSPKGPYAAQYSIFLVSAKQVEDFAIQVHGSEEIMEEIVRRIRTEKLSRYDHQILRWSNEYSDAYACDVSVRKPYRPRGLSIPLKPSYRYTSRWRCRGATDLPFWDSRK